MSNQNLGGIVMILNIDVTDKAWADVVFENKNHAYGAYDLRATTSKRLWMSFLIATLLFVVAICIPLLIKSIVKPTAAVNDDVRKFSAIVIDLPKKQEILVPKPAQALAQHRSSNRFIAPLVVEDDLVPITEKTPTQIELMQSKTPIGVVDYKGSEDPNAELAKSKADAEWGGQVSGNTNEVYIFVDQNPEFPGGERELLRFLNSNVRYPYSAQERGIAGRVVCEFVINQDGKVCNIKVLNSVDPSLDAEAMRVISHMPAWKPGKQQGVAVRVKYTLPITFSINQADN